MGKMKDELFENQETEDSKDLSTKLNITLDDLSLLVYQISTVESDDGLAYSTIIEFDLERSSKKVLNKIKGLIDGRWMEI